MRELQLLQNVTESHQCPHEGMKENFPSSDGCDSNTSKTSEPRICARKILSLARKGWGGCFCYKE